MATLWTKAAAELVGMWWVMAMGNSLIANEVLSKTKGNQMGFGFIALFFGLAFFFPLLCFSHISAALNPASMMMKLVLGRANFVDFVVLSTAEILGAFLGAVTAWVYALGHFNLTVKRPIQPHWTDPYLRPHERRQETQATIVSFFGLPNAGELNFRRQNTTLPGQEEEGGRESVSYREASGTLEVGDLEADYKRVAKPKRAYNMTDGDLLEKLHEDHPELGPEEWAYISKLIGDQSAKLSAFATRPSVFNWWQNLLTETLGTMMLLWGVYTGEDVAELVSAEWSVIYKRVFVSFYIAIYVAVCVAALGGPTGYAANTARDFGPRLAHWLLPIPNKGSSEWHYAWIPFVGPLMGGVLAAALYEATSHIML